MAKDYWFPGLKEEQHSIGHSLLLFDKDGALSNLVQWEVSLPIEGRLELDDLKKIPSKPNHLMILW